MTLYTAPPPMATRVKYFALPCCPQCGDTVLAPESSEHLSEQNVRHIWSCEACGHGFTTCVDVFRAPRRR